MEVLYPRCAGLDVHAGSVTACVRIAVDATVTYEQRTVSANTRGLQRKQTAMSQRSFAVLPSQPNAVLSPADGRIVKVENGRDPYLDRDALKISVFMNVFNVHSNRSPVDGRVIDALSSFVSARAELGADANSKLHEAYVAKNPFPIAQRSRFEPAGDSSGNTWYVATRKEDVAPAELAKRAEAKDAG